MCISLAKHQRKAYYYGRRVEHPAYFLEMRLGKTRLTIKDILINDLFPALIVAPYSALYGWYQELLFCGVPDREICSLVGTKNERLALLDRLPNGFYLTNRESHLSIGQALSKHNWKAVVLDESTCIKSPPVKRFDKEKRVAKWKPAITKFYCDNFRSVKRRYILTGTPMPESELDIFQQLKFLDPSILPFKNWWEFREMHFNKINPYDWCITERGKEYLTNKLNQYCFFMSCKEAGLYTRKVYERKVFKLQKKTYKMYKELVKTFILWNFTQRNEKELLAVTDFATVKFLMMRQLCSGFVKVDDKYKLIDSSKFDILDELLTIELKNSSVIIWSEFHHEMDHIEYLLNLRSVSYVRIDGNTPKTTRDTYLRDFQSGKVKRLITHARCFKYGANVSKADCTIYVSTPLGLESRLQSEARMNDPYSNEADLIIDLTAENTIEEKIIDSLIRKESKQEMILRLVKHLKESL